MHRIIIMRPPNPEEIAAGELTDLGIIDPTRVKDDPTSRVVMEALISENLVDKCFVPGKYVITDEEERDYLITIKHTLAIKSSRNGLMSCKVFDFNKSSTMQGAMGSLHAAEGKVVMRYDSEPGLRFEPDTERKLYKRKLYQGELTDVVEMGHYEYSKLFPVEHLAVGAPIAGKVDSRVSMTLLPIRRIHASDLFDLVSNDKGFKFNKDNKHLTALTMEDRLEILIALFVALKEQVFKYGLLHRDIKPENILVYKDAAGWKVRIEDYDFCMLQTEVSRGSVGTPQYVSPEAFIKKYSEASDIYSAALTACFLFHDKEQLILAAETDASHVFKMRTPSLQNGKTVNLMLHQQEVSDLLTACTRADASDRPNIDTCIMRARQAYLAYQQQKHAEVKGALPEIKQAMAIAQTTCVKLFSDFETKAADLASLSAMMSMLTDTIAAVPNNRFAIIAFANGLGIERCQNVDSKEKLLAILSDICEGYKKEYAHLAEQYNYLSGIKQELDEDDSEEAGALNFYLNRLTLFCEVILTTPANFNAVATATERMQHKSARVARDTFFATLVNSRQEAFEDDVSVKLGN